jgi:hypothetical protein
MNTKRKPVLRRRLLVVTVLIGWVGIALLLAIVDRPSRDQSVMSPSSVAPATPASPLILTQFVAGGPLALATQAPNGSLVIITQYPVRPISIREPTRYLLTDPDGTQREVSRSGFHSVRFGVQSLGLFDFRHQPDIQLDDLK